MKWVGPIMEYLLLFLVLYFLVEPYSYRYVCLLHLQSGSKGYKKPVLTRCTSIQGEWHERMDLIGLELKVIEK